jgi:NAD(P)H dehydrogenase (quinone)
MRNAAAGPIWESQGAEVAVADLEDSAALTRAFTGIGGVMVVLPTHLDLPDPFAANRAAILALAGALEAAGVQHLLYLSSIGAQRPGGLGAIGKLHDLERALGRLSIPSVALRAGRFMENYRALIEPAAHYGTLPSMLDPLDLAVPMIATTDIGHAAAGLLRRRPNGKQVVELAYPQPYSSNDVAKGTGSVLGRDVVAVPVPRDRRVSVYRSRGLSSAGAAAMSDMIDGFNSGWITFEGGGIERRDAPTSLAAALATLTPPELPARAKERFSVSV